MHKPIRFLLAWIFLLTACARIPQDATTAAPRFDSLNASLSTPRPGSVILTAAPSAQASATATKAFIPKRNDLVFIEFFAVT